MRTSGAYERKFVMPVKSLPPDPNLDHLKYQARDLLKAHRNRDPQAAQRIREFHPRFTKQTDLAIFTARLRLSDAQLAIARESGFASWARLKQHVETKASRESLHLPHHQRIEDAAFRQAVDLLDHGDTEGLRSHLSEHPGLVDRHVLFEGGNYFRNPTLLEFIAENPIRHGTLPANIVEIARVILDAGAKRNPSALTETLGLVCSGRVPRECQVQTALIDLLCDHGADPNSAVLSALTHGEFEAVDALMRRGALMDLTFAAGMGRLEDARRLLADSTGEDRHRALALASQFGHTEIVRLLLDAGEDMNRYNPVGFHSHSTPLHQAAFAGHEDVVRLYVERGARLDLKDTLWQGTPAGWAQHAGRTRIAEYLCAQE
jgi:hypothetical protein